ncbi:MAG: ABC transporter permease [Balneolaceae bacterium]|nr:ABC transporter permease [Balneolaceae bacterium]
MIQKLLYNLEIALDAIQQNALRSMLTSLGIIFGVASVIAMLAIGRGAQQEVLQQMQLLGTKNVIVEPIIEQQEGEVEEEMAKTREKQRYTPGLTLEDMNSIETSIPYVEYVSPEIVNETTFIRSGRMRSGKLVGINRNYFNINNFELLAGNNFTGLQIEQSHPVCIIGYDVKTKFFPGEDPIGKKIKTGNLWLTVIGVLKRRELTTENIENLGIRNYNLDIYAPVTTVLLRFGNRALVTRRDVQEAERENSRGVVVSGGGVVFGGGGEGSEEKNVNYHQIDKLIVQVSDTRYSVAIAEIIRRMLKRRHNEVIDFEIIVPELLLQQEQRTRQIFNIVLSSIASISLLVGGIGIMNIMLASVVERYREIGVRRAVGAQKYDIRLQFLTEALAISITGGILGILLGISFSYVIQWTAGIVSIVSIASIVISFGVALAIGVIFGYFPAKRAADQDPVHALRHE